MVSVLAWYCRYLGSIVQIVHLALGFLVGWAVYQLVPSAEMPIPIIAGLGTAVVAYYLVKRLVGIRCTRTVKQCAHNFGEKPMFDSRSTEKLVDAVDIDILNTIRHSPGIRGSLINLIERISDWFPTDELFRRIGKLDRLGYVRVQKGAIVMTPEGLDLLVAPPVAFQARIPMEIAADIAGVKIALANGNLNGVVDGANRLFERILREAFEKTFASALESEWAKLLADKKVRLPYKRASLGELKAAAESSAILKTGSICDDLLLAYLRIRTPQKHEVGEDVDPALGALTTMNLVEAFVRSWYAPGHAQAA